jgi:tRNA(adenine34) deaminase
LIPSVNRNPAVSHTMALPLPDPMRRALALAQAAAEAGEVPVGAVIVKDGAIVAEAANRMRAAADPTAHAEIEAIRAAARALGAERLDGCDLWVTLEPCAMCAGAIAHARIARLYYAAPDPKGGAVEHGGRIFAQPTCHHRPELYGGIGESQAGAMLRDFFERRR